MAQRAFIGISGSALMNNGPLPDGSQVIRDVIISGLERG